jgi:hypothetical protein
MPAGVVVVKRGLEGGADASPDALAGLLADSPATFAAG